jgi:hypothetical protein
VEVERSRRRTLPSEMLFRTDEEETGGDYCEQRQRADERSDRTGSHRNIAARVSYSVADESSVIPKVAFRAIVQNVTRARRGMSDPFE